MSRLFKTSYSKLLLIAFAVLLVSMTGCGLRESRTGGIKGYLVDRQGDAVVGARVLSIFEYTKEAYSGLDGSFYLEEVPEGKNTLYIEHRNFQKMEYFVLVEGSKLTLVEEIVLAPFDSNAQIDKVEKPQVTSDSAIIRWTTFNEILCWLEYSEDQSYSESIMEMRPSKTHEIKISGLKPETYYNYIIRCEAPDGSVLSSFAYSFFTAEGLRPYPPKNLEVTGFEGVKNAVFSWEAPEKKRAVAGYNIYRQEKGEDWLKVNSQPVDSTQTNYADTSLTPGTFCRYGLVSVNAKGIESEKILTPYIFVPGYLNKDLHIAEADSPVKIYGDIIVNPSVNLSIEAGTELLIAGSDAVKSGSDIDKTEILVYGRMEALGTAEKPIVFAPLDAVYKREHWGGITIFSVNSLPSALSHIHISGTASHAILATAPSIRLENIHLRYSGAGLKFKNVIEVFLNDSAIEDLEGTAIEIENCGRSYLKGLKIKDVEQGLEVSSNEKNQYFEMSDTDIYAEQVAVKGVFGRSKIFNVLAVSDRGTGFEYLDSLSGNKSNFLDHVTVDALRGVVIRKGEVSIANNIFVNRFMQGLVGITYESSLGEPEYGFNCVYGFDELYRGCHAGGGATSADPRFEWTGEEPYRLKYDSGARFADQYAMEAGRYGLSKL